MMLSRSLHLRCDKCDGIEDAVEGGEGGRGGEGGKGDAAPDDEDPDEDAEDSSSSSSSSAAVAAAFSRDLPLEFDAASLLSPAPLAASLAPAAASFNSWGRGGICDISSEYTISGRGYVDGCYCRDAAAWLFLRNTGRGLRRRGRFKKQHSALFVLLKISSPSAHPKHPKFHDAAPFSSASSAFAQ
jgi:hypothetical protein